MSDDTAWVECDAEWAFWCNDDTFQMTKVEGRVPVGAVVIVKENLDDGSGYPKVETRLSIATADSIGEKVGKRDITKALTDMLIAYARRTGKLPPKVSIKKVYKNGKVDLAFEPSRYDKYTIGLTKDILGEAPEPFVKGLEVEEAPEDEAAKVAKAKPQPAEGDEPWRVEPARSSRAACKTCNEKIAKGEVRIGEATDFQGNVGYRWHHVRCAGSRVHTPELLDGFNELSDGDQDAVRSACTSS